MKAVLIEKAVVHRIIFDAEVEGEAVVNLYKEVYPDWDRIESVDGFPTCSRKASDMIVKWILERHRQVKGQGGEFNTFPAGVWLNNGWSSMEDGDCNDTEDQFIVYPARVSYTTMHTVEGEIEVTPQKGI